jgi:hypothetical protein
MDSVPSTRLPCGGFMEYSFVMLQEELDTLRAERRLDDYIDAMRELDKEFPTLWREPKRGEVVYSTQIWVTFGFGT